MSSRKLSKRCNQRRSEILAKQNEHDFSALLELFVPEEGLFHVDEFHGNITWVPRQLCQMALIWAWQAIPSVTKAFKKALKICRKLNVEHVPTTYSSFINALSRYRSVLGVQLDKQFKQVTEEIAGPFWRDAGWFLVGFDGSRTTTPQTVSNEAEFCAPNYGNGHTAKHRKKKTKGMRRLKNEKNKPKPPVPQVWITMMWHMALRLPWAWRLGPSNSSERGHVMDILAQDEFPKTTLFCGDAGFVGFSLWHSIMAKGADFLVRVGANVKLLSQRADIQRLKDGIVLCWPKDKMKSGEPPLRLRLVHVKIGRTMMWMLTSVLDRKRLSKKTIIKYYKMRWGVEVEYRGLKQVLAKHDLRCRNSDRVYAELDWSIRAMAFAELVALRQQIPLQQKTQSRRAPRYDTKERSLANTMEALRECMDHLLPPPTNDLLEDLTNAKVQKYTNRTDKKSRHPHKNPDKKPLGEPSVRMMNTEERKRLELIDRIAA